MYQVDCLNLPSWSWPLLGLNYFNFTFTPRVRFLLLKYGSSGFTRVFTHTLLPCCCWDSSALQGCWNLCSALQPPTCSLLARFFSESCLIVASHWTVGKTCVRRVFHSSVVPSWWLSPHFFGSPKLWPLSSYPNETTSFCLSSTLNPLPFTLWFGKCSQEKSQVNVELARFPSPRDCIAPLPLVVLMLSGDIKWVFNIIYPVFK